MGRAPCCDKANVKKGPWSPEEDAQVKAYIEAHGTVGNWIALPHKIGLKRCGKSCRLRWLNYLRPNIRHGGFSDEEDMIICSLYASIGSRWSVIAAQLPGRTDNDIKNYWNTKLKKKLLGRQRDSPDPRRAETDRDRDDVNNQEGDPQRALVLERMQLHMQLQGLQNPFSFYSNHVLWPKLPPFGAAITETMAREPSGGYSAVVSPHQAMLERVQESMGTPLSSTDNSSSTVSEELDVLLHGEMKCYGVDGKHEVSGVDCCFKELDERDDGSSCSWAASNGVEEEPVPSFWSSCSALEQDLVFKDYILGYGM